MSLMHTSRKYQSSPRIVESWCSLIFLYFNRLLSIRENARAQGFPDWAQFYGQPSDKYRQIGNAVPPPLGKALGMAILNCQKEQIENLGNFLALKMVTLPIIHTYVESNKRNCLHLIMESCITKFKITYSQTVRQSLHFLQ